MSTPRNIRSIRTIKDVLPDSERGQRLWAKDRRQQLVDVASAIIAREGVDRVRIPEVATAAGVTRPVVYKFFPNRQALLVAVLEDFTDALRAGKSVCLMVLSQLS